MVASDHIYEVTGESFQRLVLDKSNSVPVAVDFWAGWCQPCRMLTPILASLVEEYQGKVVLAKINTDEQQELALQFGVRSLPTVKIFRNGETVDEFMGVQPASVIRQLLDPHVIRESDLDRERARALVDEGRKDDAIELLREAATNDSDNPRVKYDLAEQLIAADVLDEAEQILDTLPYNKRQEEPATGLYARIRFRRQAHGTEDADMSTLEKRIAEDANDLEARTQLAAQLVMAGQLESAMDQYLEIMRRDRTYQDQAGRKGLIGVFELLGDDDPRVSDYRRRMFAMMH